MPRRALSAHRTVAVTEELDLAGLEPDRTAQTATFGHRDSFPARTTLAYEVDSSPQGVSMAKSHEPSAWRRATSTLFPDICTGPRRRPCL